MIAWRERERIKICIESRGYVTARFNYCSTDIGDESSIKLISLLLGSVLPFGRQIKHAAKGTYLGQQCVVLPRSPWQSLLLVNLPCFGILSV
jgi:hypothetical protein